jgi:hypothetical protein
MTRIARTSHRSKKRNRVLVLRSTNAWLNEFVFLVPHESQLAERLYAIFNCVFAQDDTCCWSGRLHFQCKRIFFLQKLNSFITTSCVMHEQKGQALLGGGANVKTSIFCAHLLFTGSHLHGAFPPNGWDHHEPCRVNIRTRMLGLT